MRIEEAGVIKTHPKCCSPLDSVKIEFKWQGLDGQDVRFEITDARHRKYIEKTVSSANGKAEVIISAGGKAGVHHIVAYTSLQNGGRYHRCGTFRMESATSISTDTGEMDNLFEYLQEGLRQSVDITIVDGIAVTHYMHGDNTRQNIAYPLYAFAAYSYFCKDLKTAFEVLFSYQYPDGSLPDHIYGDDYPCPITGRRLRSCMADMEIGAASTIYKSWQAHGDNQWIAKLLPQIEASIEHTTQDPMKFDKEHKVIKRAHTLDEWDIQFSENGPGGDDIDENTVFVIMQGDTSGMYDACRSLAVIYENLQNKGRANYWRMMQKNFGKIGNDLFWDGVKYRHHIHLDKFDHGDFDEDNQLTMSNAFAINRGFADHKQAVSIINEYMRRLEETGDRFPWWSLQPGYPDELGYFKGQDPLRRAQGNYANGGLFPWVGGELCRGAFKHGMEDIALRLLKDFHYVIKRDDGAIFTWYDLEGNAVISSPHSQTNFDTWGLFAWMQVLIEELAGIQSRGKCFEEVLCSPKWPVTKDKETSVTANFPASDTYFSYKYSLSKDQIKLSFTGTGEKVSFRILLPQQWKCKKMTIDGKQVKFTEETIEKSHYVAVNTRIDGVHELIISK